MVPLPRGALRLALPIVLYLLLAVTSLSWTPDIGRGIEAVAQYGAVAAVYLVAYRAAGSDPASVAKLRTWSLILLPSAAFVFVRAFGDGASTFGWIRGGNSARPMVMSVALLYLLATVGRSRRFTIGVGFVALLAAAGSGGRMGTAVIVLLILFNPAMQLSLRHRLLILGAGITVFAAALQFEPIQERFFVGRSEGTITDILTMEGNVNTAGRGNNWPRIIAICSEQPIWGGGSGVTNGVTLEATSGRTGHPHNEFIRIYCESGVVGSVLFWTMFVGAGLRGFRAYRRGNNPLGGMAALAVVALILFSLSDNATIYTSVFMAPLALILGVADRAGISGPEGAEIASRL
jgi:O-antigen ligase